VDLHPDLTDLLSALAASSAEYLVVGGWAVSYHSEPRYTKDLDLLIGDDPTNLARVAEALKEFGAPATVVEQVLALGPEEFLYFGVPPVRVDLLRRIPGVEFRAALDRREVANWGSTRVSVIGRDDLIAAKRAAGRERDLRDQANPPHGQWLTRVADGPAGSGFAFSRVHGSALLHSHSCSTPPLTPLYRAAQQHEYEPQEACV
jgi:hypothetical protein